MIGEKTEAVEQFWKKCSESLEGLDAENYFVGTFVDPRLDPANNEVLHDELLQLVALGKKRATAHLALDFERNGIALREPGDYWVVVGQANDPRFLIRITDVEIKPFNEVTEDFAAREGEGDSSLEYWREAHRTYFKQQCAAWGIAWREDLLTVCEGFELVSTA